MSAQTDTETREAADLTIPSGVSDEALKGFEGMKRRLHTDPEFRERVAARYGSREVIETKEATWTINF